MTDTSEIKAFAETIHLLVNDVAGILPLAFLRADTWQERFKKYAEKAFHDRLESNKMPLLGCSREQAVYLISARIDAVFDRSKEDAASATTWMLRQIADKLTVDRSPREIISFANDAIRGVSVFTTRTDAEVFGAAYKTACDAVQSDLERWPRESEYLNRALQLWLKSQNSVLSCEQKKEKYGCFMGDFLCEATKESPAERPFGFFINTSQNHLSTGAVLRRAVDFLADNPHGRCVYIADERCNFSDTWTKTNEQRTLFEQRGGIFLILNSDTAARWYALVELSLKIGDGDIQLETKHGLAPATEDNFGDFVANHFEKFASEGKFDRLLPSVVTEGAKKKAISSKKTQREGDKSELSIPTNPQSVSEVIRDTEAETRMAQLVDTLHKYKLPVAVDGHVSGPRFIRLKITPSAEKGVTVSKIQNRAKDLQVTMGLMAPPLIQAQAGHVGVDIPRRSPIPITLLPLIQSGEPTRPSSDAVIPVGAEIDGSTFWIDLANPISPSILIGGTSGSGKSVLLQSLVLGLRLANPTLKFETTLIDPKRVTFTKFPLKTCNAELIYEAEPAFERLTILVDEMDQRYMLLQEKKYADIVDYNRENAGSPLCRHLIVVDEFADLMTDKKQTKELELLIQRIGQKGRAAGYHLILATQRPEVRVISSLIRANLQFRIAMKVTSAANSKIILDEDGAQCLTGNGDMLVGGSTAIRRLQGGMPSLTDIEAAERM